jgi:hypothetical protein
MILTAPFNTPAAVADYFNTHAALRLVSVLPCPRTATFTAIYETPPDPIAEREATRIRLLEEKLLALIDLDDDKKAKANFPKGVIEDGISVPLNTANNRLCQLVAFKSLDLAARAAWIRANAPAVGCVVIPAEEARARHGCNVELLRLED